VPHTVNSAVKRYGGLIKGVAVASVAYALDKDCACRRHILTQIQKFRSKCLAMIRNCKHQISTIGRNRQINIHILKRKLKGFSSTLTTGYRKNSRESAQGRGAPEYNPNPTLRARLNLIRGQIPCATATFSSLPYYRTFSRRRIRGLQTKVATIRI
jgi:hypothetical protein